MSEEYLITKEELKKLTEAPTSINTYDWVEEIKSKKPVKLIAEGKIDAYELSLIKLDGKKGKLLWIEEVD